MNSNQITESISNDSIRGGDFLVTLAQIGVGIIGLSGIIIAIMSVDAGLTFREVGQFRLLIEHSFGLVFYSLLPFIVFYVSGMKSASFVFKYSSILLAVFLVFEFFIQLFRVRYAFISEEIPKATVVFMTFTFFLPTLFFAALSTINFWKKRVSIYVCGVFWILIVTGFQFYIMFLQKMLG